MVQFSMRYAQMLTKRQNLVVNVVIISVVAREPLQRIEWQRVSTVVVDRLKHGNYEQKCCLANRHPSQPFRDPSTARIGHNSLDGMVVQSAVRIRYIQPVMPGVDVLEQKWVHVHAAMHEVLPSVHQETAEPVVSES